ncbi:hypothetical protein ABFB09_09040 [Dehalogenimonas sp. THU2]|uniref:hypothetical protein n=1 Tax=Dehalogenimonas sp. THU2 TaxID=3151121 RepID=UPI0032181652
MVKTQRKLPYKYFEGVSGIIDYSKIQIIALGNHNNKLITNNLNKAKEEYERKVVYNLSVQKDTICSVWNVPLTISYNSRFKQMGYKKAIMSPPYFKDMNKPERLFIDLLEDPNNKVKWWFKNGEGENKYFAIKYLDQIQVERAFYVDFIVRMKDGRLGLFDTKSGFTAQIAKEKAEALARYVKEQNQNYNKKLWGGIVTFKDGSCRINESEVYSDIGIEPQAWQFADFL